MTGGSSRRAGVVGGGRGLTCCLVTSVVESALWVTGTTLFYKLHNSYSISLLNLSASSCAPCNCDCPPPPLSLARFLPDCGSNDPDLRKELEKEFVDSLTEELRLQEAVAGEHAQHMNRTFMEARRTASEYQRKAEVCNAATH